jgi:small subunit ribosomal protein S27Ae
MADGPNAHGKHSKYSVEDGKKYSVEDGKMVRKGEFCPSCGPGVFLGVHEDRKVCGKCGHSASSK